MGKIQEGPGKGKFTITYGGLDSPMSGIDATHQSGLYLSPTSMASSGGLISQDGYINSVFLNPRFALPLDEVQPAYTIGDVQFSTVTQGPPPTIVRNSFGFIIVSYATHIRIYEYRLGFTQGTLATYDIAANKASTLTWYAVNGIVYFTGLGLGAIYAYTPGALISTVTLLTNYVGGAYLGELNGRLICLCCDQIVAGLYSYLPYQVAWSASSGNYSQWNPFVGGLVTGAGFNNLPDVADEITGFFMIGPTGYIIRKQGITEMTPLNSGIQPFDFNHMWASQKGIGSVYPNTVTQYGSLGSFLADTGIFTLGYGGINQIEGLFWAEINRFIDSLFATAVTPNVLQFLPTAGLVPLYINNERKLSMVLYIPTQDGIIFIGDPATKEWNEISCWRNSDASLTNIFCVSNKAFLSVGSDQSVACISAVFPTAGIPSPNQLVLFTLDDTIQLPTVITLPPFFDNSPFCLFPVEEVMMNRDITVDAIALTGDADVSGIDTVQVIPFIISNEFPHGKAFNIINLDSQAQYFKTFPKQNAVTPTIPPQFTGKYPQLSIQMIMPGDAPSAVRIYKIVVYCSYDIGQIP